MQPRCTACNKRFDRPPTLNDGRAASISSSLPALPAADPARCRPGWSGLAGLLLGTGSGTGAYLLAMAVLGIPHGLTFPVALAMVADVTPTRDLPRANATLIGGTSLVSVLVPLALGGIVPAVGYKATTLVMLAPVGLFGLLQLGLARRPRTGWRRVPAGTGRG